MRGCAGNSPKTTIPHLNVKDYHLHYKVNDHTDAWTKPDTVLFVHGFTKNTEA